SRSQLPSFPTRRSSDLSPGLLQSPQRPVGHTLHEGLLDVGEGPGFVHRQSGTPQEAIQHDKSQVRIDFEDEAAPQRLETDDVEQDRKSTRLNSSHVKIS